MVSSVVERVQRVISQSGLKQGAFANRCGIQPPNLNKRLKGDVGFTDGYLLKIADAFGVNIRWLRDGIGEMYAEEKHKGRANYRELVALNISAGARPVNTASGENSRATQTIGMPDADVSALREEVAALKARVSVMEKMMEDKDRIIERLISTLGGRQAP